MNINWGQVAATAGPIIAAAAASKAKGRGDEARINQTQDAGALNAYSVDKRSDLDALIARYEAALKQSQGLLDERKAALEEPQQLASNSLRGDMLANAQDITVNAPPGVNVTSFGGGFTPSMMSGNTRGLGQKMSRDALINAMDGKAPMPFSGMGGLDVSSITGRSAPAQTTLPQPSGFDRAMEQIGLWSSLAGGVGTAMGQPAQQQQQAQTLAGQLATNPYRGLGNVMGTQVSNPTWG
jgi:hypothetical protein